MNKKYPDQLWKDIFGEESEPPEDSDEVITYLLHKKGLTELDKKLIDLRYIQGLSYKKVGEACGFSGSRAGEKIRYLMREIRHTTALRKNGVTVKHGLKVNQQIVDGEAEVCYVCEKVIYSRDMVFLIPSYRYGGGMPVPMLKICCCELCAYRLLNQDIEQRQERIDKARAALEAEMEEMRKLKDCDPQPLKLAGVLTKAKLSEEPLYSKARYFDARTDYLEWGLDLD